MRTVKKMGNSDQHILSNTGLSIRVGSRPKLLASKPSLAGYILSSSPTITANKK